MSMRIKKIIALIAAACCLAPLLSGCAVTQKTADTTTVTIVYSGELNHFKAFVEEQIPGLTLACEHIASSPLGNTIERRLRAGDGPDLVVSTQPADAESIAHVLPLDGYAFSAQYESTVLKNLLDNDRLYYLPLPGQYNGYVVNKTLLDEAGLALPETNEEFINMLVRMRELNLGVCDTGHVFGLREVAPSALGIFVTGCLVPDFLGTAAGVQWLAGFEEGTAGMTGAWEGAFAFLEELVANDLINVTPFSRQGNAVNNAVYMGQGKLVAAFGSTAFLAECEQYNAQYAAEGESPAYEYVMLPFLGSGGAPAWTVSLPANYLGINAALKEKGNEEKLELCVRILELLSTQAGQEAIMRDLMLDNSYLKGFSKMGGVPAGLEEAVENGYVYYAKFPGKVIEYLGLQTSQLLGGKRDIAACLAAVDEYYRNGSAEADEDLAVVGRVSQDLIYYNYNTRREECALGNLVADSIALFSGAPIAVANGGGIRASLYAGDVTGGDLKAVCPYDNQIIVVEMTGEVLRAMLENARSTLEGNETIPGGRFLQVSGIRYTYDDSQPLGGRVAGITLSDGTPVTDQGVYTVAVTNYMAGVNGYLEGNGDGYAMLNLYSQNDPPARGVTLVRENLGTYREALAYYFSQHQDAPVSATVEGRIADARAAD